jgi:hypothetical protein
MNVLKEAETLVNGERRQQYGPILESFQKIAKMWSMILGITVTTQHVAMCMIALKLCRHIPGFKRDNLVDICGYAYLAEILNRQEDPQVKACDHKLVHLSEDMDHILSCVDCGTEIV